MGSDPAGGDVVARRRWHWSAILIGLLTGLGLVMRQSIMARDSLFLANTSMCWYRYRRGWPFWFLAGNESYWNRADYLAGKWNYRAWSWNAWLLVLDLAIWLLMVVCASAVWDRWVRHRFRVRFQLSTLMVFVATGAMMVELTTWAWEVQLFPDFTDYDGAGNEISHLMRWKVVVEPDFGEPRCWPSIAALLCLIYWTCNAIIVTTPRFLGRTLRRLRGTRAGLL